MEPDRYRIGGFKEELINIWVCLYVYDSNRYQFHFMGYNKIIFGFDGYGRIRYIIDLLEKFNYDILKYSCEIQHLGINICDL